MGPYHFLTWSCWTSRTYLCRARIQHKHIFSIFASTFASLNMSNSWTQRLWHMVFISMELNIIKNRCWPSAFDNFKELCAQCSRVDKFIFSTGHNTTWPYQHIMPSLTDYYCSALNSFTMDVISSTAFGIQMDSKSNPDHPMIWNAKEMMGLNVKEGILGQFKTIIRIALFFSKSTSHYKIPTCICQLQT